VDEWSPSVGRSGINCSNLRPGSGRRVDLERVRAGHWFGGGGCCDAGDAARGIIPGTRGAAVAQYEDRDDREAGGG
jgi:hypothetical protein